MTQSYRPHLTAAEATRINICLVHGGRSHTACIAFPLPCRPEPTCNPLGALRCADAYDSTDGSCVHSRP